MAAPPGPTAPAPQISQPAGSSEFAAEVIEYIKNTGAQFNYDVSSTSTRLEAVFGAPTEYSSRVLKCRLPQPATEKERFIYKHSFPAAPAGSDSIPEKTEDLPGLAIANEYAGMQRYHEWCQTNPAVHIKAPELYGALIDKDPPSTGPNWMENLDSYLLMEWVDGIYHDTDDDAQMALNNLGKYGMSLSAMVRFVRKLALFHISCLQTTHRTIRGADNETPILNLPIWRRVVKDVTQGVLQTQDPNTQQTLQDQLGGYMDTTEWVQKVCQLVYGNTPAGQASAQAIIAHVNSHGLRLIQHEPRRATDEGDDEDQANWQTFYFCHGKMPKNILMGGTTGDENQEIAAILDWETAAYLPYSEAIRDIYNLQESGLVHLANEWNEFAAAGMHASGFVTNEIYANEAQEDDIQNHQMWLLHYTTEGFLKWELERITRATLEEWYGTITEEDLQEGDRSNDFHYVYGSTIDVSHFDERRQWPGVDPYLDPEDDDEPEPPTIGTPGAQIKTLDEDENNWFPRAVFLVVDEWFRRNVCPPPDGPWAKFSSWQDRKIDDYARQLSTDNDKGWNTRLPFTF